VTDRQARARIREAALKHFAGHPAAPLLTGGRSSIVTNGPVRADRGAPSSWGSPERGERRTVISGVHHVIFETIPASKWRRQ
jgi:hypothetical protein